jgi:carbonic anhydrase
VRPDRTSDRAADHGVDLVSSGVTETRFMLPRTEDHPPPARTLTKEERDNLTPDAVLALLEAGNRRFVSGTRTERDHAERIRASALGQHPKAVILSCIDSRVPVEEVFDVGIGDVVVARIAGNFVNTDILGSMEFGCKVLGAKLILVLGHTQCGAIMGTIDGVDFGNIAPLLDNIRPSVEHFVDYDGAKASTNEEFVHMVTVHNVRRTMGEIRRGSDILDAMAAAGEIMIAGGLYDTSTGTVELLAD